ncbi:ligase-associated DNA damage response exonuclease [Sphingobacterium hungaricum]|uniref:DNA ligase-associated DEXH box helicase n=1 Tax=Sphingobacterium hungaricum TaxID=2082723 RepID=A0A928YRG2_9SPHI|nr:ligase-associated DNA damage response exonuclease [Sphingobacterium hungaricum]MBE8714959.1 DNA ligase-associated DEXH box helicase [Sphingobacterium hungaricum]
MKLLTVNQKGLYCKQADVYLDPWKPVDTALISHGHSDHMRWGMKNYICQEQTVPILNLRIGAENNVRAVAYNDPFEINGVKISFHPAGHIIGSSQIRLEYEGEVWVFTGDYKIVSDGVSQPYELVKCDHFITESTFGLPIYNFPDPHEIYEDINTFWRKNVALGYNTVLLGYSLGKAQNILAHLDQSIGDIYLHGAVANTNEALATIGYDFPGVRITPENDRSKIKGAVIVAPPSASDTPWLRKMTPYKIAMCSGWMQLRGARRRRGVDKGFPLSDHCDWQQLNQAVQDTGAKHVYVTHGYENNFSKWVSEEYGIKSSIFKTLYNDEEEEVSE